MLKGSDDCFNMTQTVESLFDTGLERYKALQNQLNLAIKIYQSSNSAEGFIPVIEDLLVNYYDPMYDYQIKKKESRIVFEGDANEVKHYLSDRSIR